MKDLLRIAFGFALIANAASAATWTVDNDLSHPANFRTIQDAIDSASQDDVILVSGSASLYAPFNLNKRLKIRGPGYFLVENGIPCASRLSATIGFSQSIGGGIEVNQNLGNPFLSGSGSVLEGLDILTSINTVENVSGCVFRRCKFSNTVDISSPSCVFHSCYASGLGSFVIRSNNSIISNSILHTIEFSGSGTIVTNCIIHNKNGGVVYFNSSEDSVFIDSIFIGPFQNSTVKGGSFAHCIATVGFPLIEAAGNINSATPSEIFVAGFATSGGTDRGYEILSGGMADNTGHNGADIGIFGGSSPYVISGIPAIPRIKTLTMPALVPDSTGLTFEVHAEARD